MSDLLQKIKRESSNMTGLSQWITDNQDDFWSIDRWPQIEYEGIKIYMDRNCPDIRTRTWRERLFTRPWRPFKKTELHDLLYFINTSETEKFGLCSPRVFYKLKRAISGP